MMLVVASSCDGETTETSAVGGPELSCSPGQTRSCYEGPDETAGIGTCAPGVQACLQHGRGWGACVGQVLPEQENCDAPSDENCDGLTSCGQTIWANRFGVDRDEAVFSLDADAAGNLYVGGFYRAAIDLGGGPLPTSNNSIDLFVAKYDNDGNHVWSVGFHGPSNLQPRDIAVSRSGDTVAFVANVNGDVVMGDTTLAPNGDDDVLVVVLDGDGAVRWAKRVGDDDEQFPMGVAVDDQGHVVLTGHFEGELDFGGTPLTSAGFNFDAFVAKLDENGDELWSRAYNGPLDQLPRAVTVATDGRVLVAGRTSGRIDFGGGELVASGESADIFLLALDADGEHLFSRQWGGDGADEAWAVTTDSAGNGILTGRFEGEVRFGATLHDAVGAGAIFVTKVDMAGNDLWTERIGGSSDQTGSDVVVDTRDRIVVTGYYEGDVPFGTAKLPPSGIREPNILIAKLEPTGAPVWARGIAVTGNQSAGGTQRGFRSLAALPGDFIALGGFVQQAIDMGDGPLEDFGAADLLLAKLAP